MINVKSENGFFYENPQDYLDGKINDKRFAMFTIYSISDFPMITDDSVFGHGACKFTFVGKNQLKFTEKELIELFENIDLPFAFFIKPTHYSLTWRNADDTFSMDDYPKFQEICNSSTSREQVVDRVRNSLTPITRKDAPLFYKVGVHYYGINGPDNSEWRKATTLFEEVLGQSFGTRSKITQEPMHKQTDRQISIKAPNGIIPTIKDINGKDLKVGDKCYISIGSGRIRLITIDEIKPASVKVSGGWSGLLMTASNDFLKVK